MSDRFVRWGGIAAIVFVVCILFTAFSAGSPPAADGAAEKIQDYLADHRTILLIGNTIALLAVPLVVWWAIVFREVVRRDTVSNALGTGTLAGILITAPMAMAGGAISVSVIYLSKPKSTSGELVRVLFEAQTLLFGATSAGLLLMALTAGLAIRRTGALPAITMWLAFLAALGNLVAMGSTLSAKYANIGFAGLLSFTLFLLVTGIVMAAGKAAPADRVTAPMAA